MFCFFVGCDFCRWLFRSGKVGVALWRPSQESDLVLVVVLRPFRSSYVASLSSMAHTSSSASRVTRRASSTTDCGTARDGRSSLAAPLAPFFLTPLTTAPPPFSSVPLVVLPLALADGAMAMTRRTSAGKLVTSPERSRERAWAWTAVGQLEEWACRECRRLSWILDGERF
jgi:hypothetical protein